MAELADAHGSGPCESNFMQVQVLLPAPKKDWQIVNPFCIGGEFMIYKQSHRVFLLYDFCFYTFFSYIANKKAKQIDFQRKYH